MSCCLLFKGRRRSMSVWAAPFVPQGWQKTLRTGVGGVEVPSAEADDPSNDETDDKEESKDERPSQRGNALRNRRDRMHTYEEKEY